MHHLFRLCDGSSGLPPSQGIGGRPKKPGRQRDFTIPPPVRQPRQLAEGVEFLERYADFSPFDPSFGGRGSNLREKCGFLAAGWITTRLGVILNDASLPPC